MPYVDLLERIRLAKEAIPVPKTVGDLNYLITLDILSDFLKEPRYHQIHAIYKLYVLNCISVYYPEWRKDTFGLTKKFDLQDFETACHLAYQEFSSRVVRKYEDLCIKKNGDVDAYKEVLSMIAEKEKQIKIKE